MSDDNGGLILHAAISHRAHPSGVGIICVRCNEHWPCPTHQMGQRLEAVQALIDHAKKVSPSDRMTVYVGDLEHALGQRDERARTRTGANAGPTKGAEQ